MLKILMSGLFALMPLLAVADDPQLEGRAYLAQGENAVAVKKFAEAAKANPFDASALNNQAVAYAAQGDAETALNLLERAARLSPSRTDIAANLTELRNWMSRNTAQLLSSGKAPIMNVYPNQNDLPPAPPALWRK